MDKSLFILYNSIKAHDTRLLQPSERKQTMKTSILRILAVCLIVVLVLPSLASCAGRGKTLLSMEKDGIKVTLSVNVYELMLSRGKGNLINNGENAHKESYWSYTSKFGGDKVLTYDEYYRSLVLDNCRTYVVAMYLYEKAGLSLSDKAIENVEKQMEELVKENGGGSKAKLNSVLAEYGVNYDILKDAYLMYEKMIQLQNHLYGENAKNVGIDIKDEFLKEHYLHFKQIYFPNSKFVYEKDSFGHTAYYYTSGDLKDHFYYDTGNGVPGYNEDGSKMTDKYGDVIYFINNGKQDKIAYNTTYGRPLKIMNGSSYKTEELTSEEKTRLEERVNTLYQTLEGCTAVEFESAYQQILEEYTALDEAYGSMHYEDGYYIRKDIDYLAAGAEYEYLSKIVTEFATMQAGETMLVPSPQGYHIIMKYDLPSKAYENEVNEGWFSDFHQQLIDRLFIDMCSEYFDSIVTDEKILATAPTMKEVGANIYGY